MDRNPLDPYKELLDNIDKISAVKRCPKCRKLTLEFDSQNNRIFCSNCDFERYLPK